MAQCELKFNNNFELIVSVILSAQCTDKRVVSITPKLFAKYPTAHDLARADISDVENIIKPCGFYHNKARNIIECSKDLDEKYGGVVPSDFDKLVSLKGVGRKTASVVLVVGFNEPAMPVDTHVFRVSNRLGIGDPKSVVACEKRLKENVPRSSWTNFHSRMVLFGRYNCKAIKPMCENCKLQDICLYHKSKLV